MRKFARQFQHFFLAMLTIVCFAGADWLQFRGTHGSSVSNTLELPVTWSENEHVAWKLPLVGRGVGGPIVVAGKVITTSSSGPKQDRLHVSCVDATSGKLLWERQFWATGRTHCHPLSAVAAPTPASDGKRIFAFYSSNDLACLDLDGNLLWFRGLTFDHPTAANDVGMAASPLVFGSTVVVQIESQGESFVAGIDSATGETRWQKPRPSAANWCSPVAMPGKSPDADAVLAQSGGGIVAYHPTTGKELWTYAGGGSGIASSTVQGDIALLPGSKLTALRRSAGSLAVEVLWESTKLAAGSASPVLHEERVYVLNRAGVLTCGNAQDGETVWQLRLKGPYWATPVLVGNHLYTINQEGLAQVVRLGDKGELAGESNFGEVVLGSPAVVDGALYVRSVGHLWKIAK